MPAWLDILATHCFLTSLVIALLCRAIQDLHRETAQKLRVDNGCIEEVEALLKQLEQLLVGISIMQVRGRPGRGGWRAVLGQRRGGAGRLPACWPAVAGWRACIHAASAAARCRRSHRASLPSAHRCTPHPHRT